MNPVSRLKVLALVLVCAALAANRTAAHAAAIKAQGGGTFQLTPTAAPGVFTDSADGVARVSFLGIAPCMPIRW